MILNNDKYKILSDTERSLESDEDFLGTKIYVDILYSIISGIKNSDNIETIALSGPWGSGKSSIMKTLKEKTKKDRLKIKGKKVKFYNYNAWKYNNDDFRKTFLLSIDDSDKIEEQLYSEESITSYKINFQVIQTIVIIVLCLLFFLILFFKNGGYNDLNTLEFVISALRDIVVTTIFGIVATSLSQILLLEETVTRTQIFSPQRFSDMFEKIMSKKRDFCIFVIDDLDRCNDEQVIEILETIHGYLQINQEKATYIFIIPIDKGKLNSILKREREYCELESVEFYNKIFDITVQIDKFQRTDMFSSIQNINDMYNYKFSNLSLSLLSDFLIMTPRDLIKEINEINLLRTSIENKKKNGFISNNHLDNIDEITALYILKKNWPSLYNVLLDKKMKGMEIDSEIRVYNKDNKDTKLSIFEVMIGSISLNSIIQFEYLRDSESNFSETLKNAFLNSNYEEIRIQYHEGCNIIGEYYYVYEQYIWNRGLRYVVGKDIFISYIFLLELLSGEEIDELFNIISIEELSILLSDISTNRESSGILNDLPVKSLFRLEKDDYRINLLINNLFENSIISSSTDLVIELLNLDAKTEYILTDNLINSIDHLNNSWSVDYDDKLVSALKISERYVNALSKEFIDNLIVSKSEHSLQVIFDFDCTKLSDKYSLIFVVYEIKDMFGSSYIENNDGLYIEKIKFLNTLKSEEMYSQFELLLHEITTPNFIKNFAEMSVELKRQIAQFLVRGIDYNNEQILEYTVYMVESGSYSNETSNIITGIINSNLSDCSIRYDLLMLLMNKSNYELSTIENLITYVKSTDVSSNRKDFLKLFSEYRENYSSTTYILNSIDKSISYNSNNLDKIINCTTYLDNELLILVFKVLDFDRIVKNKEIIDRIKSRKSYAEIFSVILDKVDSIEKLLIVSPFITRSTHRVKYNTILDNLLLNNPSMSDLRRIHDIEEISRQELNKIKKYINENYSESDIEHFHKISW